MTIVLNSCTYQLAYFSKQDSIYLETSKNLSDLQNNKIKVFFNYIYPEKYMPREDAQ